MHKMPICSPRRSVVIRHYRQSMRGHRWNTRVSSEGEYGAPSRHVAFFASCRMGNSTIDAKSTLQVQVLVDPDKACRVMSRGKGRLGPAACGHWQHVLSTYSGNATAALQSHNPQRGATVLSPLSY